MTVVVLDAASVGLALGAGMLAAVNPCGFALLPSYLTTFVLDPEAPSPASAVGRALRATIALTLGFGGVFLLFGLLILPVAASVQAYLPAFTVALGIALAFAGAWVAAGRKLPTPRLGGKTGGKPLTASWGAMTGFGVSYALASLGCTLAPFLAVVLTSFRADNPIVGLLLFVVYAAGMGLTVGVAATAVALARRRIVTSMRQASAAVPRIAGVVLAVSGAYVAWYGIWELRVLHLGAGADPIVEAAGHVRGWVAAGINGAGWLGAAAALVVLIGVALWLRPRSKRGQAEKTRL